jgi:hypothetical protein
MSTEITVPVVTAPAVVTGLLLEAVARVSAQSHA